MRLLQTDTLKCAEKQMNEFMNRLADLILIEIQKRNCSIACFADICGISKNEVGNITTRKKKDIYVSTLLKICENSDIKFSDVFEVNCSEELKIENFILTDGKEKYMLKKLSRGDYTSAF